MFSLSAGAWQGDLDSKNSNLVLKLLRELNRDNGVTCIMVTHDQVLPPWPTTGLTMCSPKT